MNSAQIRLAFLIAITGLAAALIGASVAVLPPIFSVSLSAILLTPLVLLLLARAPEMTDVPHKALSNLFVATIFLYFVWPRNAFIPVSALPVKHPQKMMYLTLVAILLYTLIKCAPLRSHLQDQIKSNRWLFITWALLGIWQIITSLTSQEVIYSLFRSGNDFLSIYALLPLTVCCIRDEKDTNKILKALLIAACINTAYAVAEFATKRNIFASLISIGEIDANVAKQVLMDKVRGGSYRAQASFDHPILFAEFLCMTLPIALANWYVSDKKIAPTLLILSILAGLVLSQSRTALIAGAIAAGIAMIVIGKDWAKESAKGLQFLTATLILSPLILLIGYIALSSVLTIISGRSYAESSSTSSRLDMLHDGLTFLSSQWLTGYGPGVGGYALNFASGDGVLTLDNYYLLIALDSGAPAFLMFVGFIALSIGTIAKANIRKKTLALGIPGALIAFSMTKAILGTNLNNILLPIISGVILAQIKSSEFSDAKNTAEK